MQRRNFIHILGGSAVIAATAPLSGCASATLPTDAVEAWSGPAAAETDPRRRALAFAITAPNPHNLQPWLADLREPGIITVYTDPARVLPETDPFGRQILIGHGAFLELLVLALADQGMGADVVPWPKGELSADLAAWKTDQRLPIARITLKPGAAAKDPLFAQVLKRHTAKSNFDTTRSVPLPALESLIAAGAAPGVASGGTQQAPRVAAMRRLCMDAAAVELRTERTFMESLRLIRVGPAEISQHRDGISINEPKVRVLTALGLFDRSKMPAPGSPGDKNAFERFQGHSETAMAFVWLVAPNTRSAQVQAGRAYVRMALKAAELGVGIHPMSQALQEFAEMKPHYERAHQLVLNRAAPHGATDPALQMFCRIGYTSERPSASPRRALERFVV